VTTEGHGEDRDRGWHDEGGGDALERADDAASPNRDRYVRTKTYAKG